MPRGNRSPKLARADHIVSSVMYAAHTDYTIGACLQRKRFQNSGFRRGSVGPSTPEIRISSALVPKG